MKQRYAKWVMNYKGAEITSENYGEELQAKRFGEEEKEAIMAIRDEILDAWNDVVFGGGKWEDVTLECIKNTVQEWLDAGETEILKEIEIVQVC